MKKTIALLLTALLAISLLASCSAGKNSYDSYDGGGTVSELGLYNTKPAPSAPQASAAPEDSANYASRETAYDSEVMAGEVYDASFSAAGGGGASQGGLAEKKIYSGQADIETVDFDATIDRVYEMLELNGGFIESSHVGGLNYGQRYYGYQAYRSAQFVLRVPVERFDTIVKGGGLEALGNVTSKDFHAQNITAQFYDTESRLASLRTEEERLLAMLAKSDTVADMIAIEARLSEVRYNIESLTSTLRNWQNQVDYSDLTLYIQEVEKLTETAPTHRTYWQQIGDGFQLTVKNIGAFFMDVFKWLAVNLPVLVIIAVVVVIVAIILGKKFRSGKNRLPPGDK